MDLQLRPAFGPAVEIASSAMEGPSDVDQWAAVAEHLWLKDVKKSTAKELKQRLWDPLEAEGFQARSLATLENLQALEKYLWPTYNENSSNQHVILIAGIVAHKQKSHLPVWDIFVDRTVDFSSLFKRVLSMNLDSSLSVASRLFLLSFITGAYQSLETGIVRKECAPLVSISLWHHLQNLEACEHLLDKNQNFRKAWRAAAKRYNAADEATQARIRFERAWLPSMLLDFIRRLSLDATDLSNLLYVERFLELLVDLNSQLPTRRYVHILLKDLNILPLLRTSKLYQNPADGLVRDFVALLDYFLNFPIDDSGSSEHTSETVRQRHCNSLARLQRTAFRYFKEKLTVLALSNYASIDTRSELQPQLEILTDDELQRLCELLGFRTSYPKQAEVITDRRLYFEILLTAFERPKTFQQVVAELSSLPSEKSLYDISLLRNESYDGTHPLAIPKLNLQYLSLGDFLWRSFLLHRAEAFFEIRKDLEMVVKRMRPQVGRDAPGMVFEGFSKMAIPIDKPAILEVAPPKVSTDRPAYVRAEISLDVSRLPESVRFGWESLRPDEVVFLVAVVPKLSQPLSNGQHSRTEDQEWQLEHVRAATIVQVLDHSGKPIRDQQNAVTNGASGRPRQRRLLVNLDSASYQADSDRASKNREALYSSINVVVRRQGRENNFRPVLETMQRLVASEAALPPWFQEVFLGYGDPTSANYTQLESKLPVVDFRDTFMDWEHLVESFPSRSLEPEAAQGISLTPPYVLHPFHQPGDALPVNPPKKRRRNEADVTTPALSPIKITTYQLPNTGPYPMDTPKLNSIRFTPAQVEAIMSGTQPGLTVVIGPPGTGKTDVATQIINLLYHNFPSERILLVAHSNQALNQLFKKIILLDIDARHLLRLGHGEEELETNVSYSKYGRVESFLENRAGYLGEVARMAATIGAEGAHGNSCETADYFNQVYIQPAWSKYWDFVHAEGTTNEQIIQAFPFHAYFSSAPQPLFDPSASTETLISVAAGCQHHISKIFTELEDIRPFEILRSPKDKANYLLVKEARIIAMTSTHAAMRRQEIADLGFHYDTVVMEEAAQITEVESFIPCAMQQPDATTGQLPLKRIVLCGDHLQNSPIIQNMAFRQYANLEQSLFLRLVRLGVPTVVLDRQGRCRPSIAQLFQWRYPQLGNLPNVSERQEFLRANAGFRYDYQFIDVPDYQGLGEREPSSHFIQNLGEAEYAVAIYQYMRLLGYPANKISILATYAGQKALIRDVLEHRCKGNRLFGLPRVVTTVDKYQGEQNDYVILSLTRTRAVGYLRDVRRLTVALSRARLGLYILGRRELFETCYEMKPAMDLLLSRPTRLTLTTGEMFPANRLLEADPDAATEMHGLEHLGQYVYEMTQAKIKAMDGEVSAVTRNGEHDRYGADEDDLDAALAEADEENPSHEQS